jgi:hypothetical protein
VGLSWGAWAQLGVSGWSETHHEWGIDVEPLIFLTAWLGDADPRLRDEATDWCIRNVRLVSRVRLKNLLRVLPADIAASYGEFAGTVSAHLASKWPDATAPRPYTPTGRSTAPLLGQSSAAWLRLRALFGVGARSEIMRVLLSSTERTMSVAAIATATAFTKRNVADECEALASAGVLALRQVGNRFYYALARPQALEEFVGDLPAIRPSWPALVRVVHGLVLLEDRADRGPTRTLAVDVQKTLQLIGDDIQDLHLELPATGTALDEAWEPLRQRASQWLTAWSTGQWPTPSRMPSWGQRHGGSDPHPRPVMP